jgi:F-type H+-transporting ATPase subunit b
MLLLIQEHAADASQLPAPFRPSSGLFIWTIVVFISLLILLWKYAFPVIVKSVAEREQRLIKLNAEAKQARDEAMALLEEQKTLLGSARNDANLILAEARQAAERERTLGMEKTRLEQDEMLVRARRDIAAEKDRAIAELRRETVDLAIAAASKVVGERIDVNQDRKLVEDYLATVGSTS